MGSRETECRRPTHRAGSVQSRSSAQNAQHASFMCTNSLGHSFDCGGGVDTCCGDGCKAPGDMCCTNANNDKFPCHGSCCGNACAAPGSKCCRVGNFTEWYPVSYDTQCRSLVAQSGVIAEVPRQRQGGMLQASGRCTNSHGHEFDCGGGVETCCGNGCKAPGDVCCTNANNDKFPCHGSCCGNACAAPGSKCCKVGNFTEWYPVSDDTECRSALYG